MNYYETIKEATNSRAFRMAYRKKNKISGRTELGWYFGRLSKEEDQPINRMDQGLNPEIHVSIKTGKGFTTPKTFFGEQIVGIYQKGETVFGYDEFLRECGAVMPRN